MNKADTIEAIKEAKRLSSTTMEYKQILVVLEIFYAMGERAAMTKERDKLVNRRNELKVVKN